MSVLSDREINIRSHTMTAWRRGPGGRPMIEPFQAAQSRVRTGADLIVHKAISYGCTSYGYDARVGRDFRVFRPRYGIVIDPKHFNDDLLEQVNDVDYIDIPPQSYVLGQTVEYFRIPRDCLAICIGKSTYARCGIIVNVTPLEPEWEGTITVEISNSTPCPARIYSGEGIMQVVFFKAEPSGDGKLTCDTSYADRAGKYQGQREITLPKV